MGTNSVSKDIGYHRLHILKIIHVTTVSASLGFFHGHIGYQKQRGFSVEAVTSPDMEANQFCSRENITLHPILMKRKISIIKDLISLWRMTCLFIRVKPDIVHSHTPKACLIGTLSARLTGVPVIFLSIFGLPQMTKDGWMKQLLNLTTRLACSIAHKVWCDSPSISNYLVNERLCKKIKIIVLGNGSVNGVEAETEFSPSIQTNKARIKIRSRYGIPDDALVIGYVGRIANDKGIAELISSWSTLRNYNAKLHFLIVGAFDEEDPLTEQDQLTLHKDPRVHQVGYQSDVAQHYAAMDIFVLPSYREGFPKTNIEAAAMSLPVVTTNIPGCVDTVKDGETAILVPPRNAKALMSAIRRYVDHPELRQKHGKAGRERVLRDFRPAIIRKSLVDEYFSQLYFTNISKY